MPESLTNSAATSSTGLIAGIYVLCVAGAIALALLLPRGRRGRINLNAIGWVIGVASLGAAFLLITRMASSGNPSPDIYFYFFAFLALVASVKVVTHPKPVYSALYFILTVLASAGLYLLLAAEFMAFALIIVYAGAILITYLFVIMLAHDKADGNAEAARQAAEVDTVAREPVAAAAVGFLLLAVLTSAMVDSLSTLPPARMTDPTDDVLVHLDRKAASALREADALDKGQMVIKVDPAERLAVVGPKDGSVGGENAVPLPDSLHGENIESVGWSLLSDFPVSLELAGVILLLAMIGAVVLVRSIQDPHDAEAEV